LPPGSAARPTAARTPSWRPGPPGCRNYHAREFFLPFMGAAGAALTPLLLDAVVFWLASACIRQARAGRPLPMLRAGAYALLALTVTANARQVSYRPWLDGEALLGASDEAQNCR
jgi:hypothetical protein